MFSSGLRFFRFLPKSITENRGGRRREERERWVIENRTL